MTHDWGKPLFILEMANNHMGDVEHGRRIIHAFAEVVKEFPFKFAFKLQYRNLDTFIHPDFKSRADVKFVKRFSETRLREADFLALKLEMEQHGFGTMCTPFDEASVDLVLRHGFDFLKIGSCSFTDWPLLERIAAVDLPIVASTAGASLQELDRVVSFFEHRQKNVTLMHCVGSYPTPLSDSQLNQIDVLRERYPQMRVGFSTHEPPADHEIVLAAIAKGATVFERHVALATERYTPNAYSSTPEQVRRWLESAQKGFTICGVADARFAGTPEAMAQLADLRRGVFATRRLQPGMRLTPSDYFLAIPACKGQLLANDLSKYHFFAPTQVIEANAPLLTGTLTQEEHEPLVRAILRDVRKHLKHSHITLPSMRSDLEISHHYGLDRFREFGVVMVSFVNREYCKKVLVMLPGQKHPEHMHKLKEETFYVVHGEMTLALDGVEKVYKAGDSILVGRGVKHHFATKRGVIFEEISSTHSPDDSFYTDPVVMQNEHRKTFLNYWMD